MADHLTAHDSNLSFSSLPIEIQEEIWLWTFEPRTITVLVDVEATSQRQASNSALAELQQNLDESALDRFLNVSVSFKATQGVCRGTGSIPFLRKVPTPVALHVCRDSRMFASKIYKRCFFVTQFVYDREHEKALGVRAFGSDLLWVDFTRDKVFLNRAAMTSQSLNCHLMQDIISYDSHSQSHFFPIMQFPVESASERNTIRRIAIRAIMNKNGRRLPRREVVWTREQPSTSTDQQINMVPMIQFMPDAKEFTGGDRWRRE